MGRLRLSIFPNVGEIFQQRVGSTNVRIDAFDQFAGSFHLAVVQRFELVDDVAHLVGDDAHDSVFKVLGESLLHICIVAENPRFVLHLLQNFTIAKGRPGRVAVFEREGRR